MSSEPSLHCQSCVHCIDEAKFNSVHKYPWHCQKGSLQFPHGKNCKDFVRWSDHYRDVVDEIPKHRKG